MRLWMIHGLIYAADPQIYLKVKGVLSDSLKYSHYDFTQTNEIGKIKNIDPLKRSHLRIRGMWDIDHPDKIFQSLNTKNNKLNVILTKEKYDSFKKEDRDLIEQSKIVNINLLEIPDPNNPMKLVPAYHIFIKMESYE